MLFDDYESHGASEIDLHLIQTLVPTDTSSVCSNADHATSPYLTVNSTPQRHAGQFSANELTQQDDGEFDGGGNTGNGGGGWGSGPTPIVFRPFSGESYSVTSEAHKDRVSVWRRQVQEEDNEIVELRRSKKVEIGPL